MIAVQCRDKNRRLDLNDVDEFSSVLRDIGATKGIMVAVRGYTASAKTYARNLGIALMHMVDAENAMWAEYFGSEPATFRQVVQASTAIIHRSLQEDIMQRTMIGVPSLLLKLVILGIFLVIVSIVPMASSGNDNDVLTTSPVLGDRVTCLLANAGDKPVTVTVELVGNTTFTLTSDTTFGPGGFAAWGMGDDDIAYCRFTISSGNPARVRASACGISSILGNKCATSSEAR